MATSLDATLAALADPARRAIIESLRGGPLPPSSLADAVGLTRPATSRHLRVLRSAGLVTQRIDPDDARVRRVGLRREPFRRLRGWLEEVEAFWGEQLEAFRLHAEAQVSGGSAAEAPGRRRRGRTS